MYVALWPVLGSLDRLFDVLGFIGSDGGRPATVGIVLAVLSACRAVVITPPAEELLFRGALHGGCAAGGPPCAGPGRRRSPGSRGDVIVVGSGP